MDNCKKMLLLVYFSSQVIAQLSFEEESLFLKPSYPRSPPPETSFNSSIADGRAAGLICTHRLIIPLQPEGHVLGICGLPQHPTKNIISCEVVHCFSFFPSGVRYINLGPFPVNISIKTSPKFQMSVRRPIWNSADILPLIISGDMKYRWTTGTSCASVTSPRSCFPSQRPPILRLLTSLFSLVRKMLWVFNVRWTMRFSWRYAKPPIRSFTQRRRIVPSRGPSRRIATASFPPVKNMRNGNSIFLLLFLQQFYRFCKVVRRGLLLWHERFWWIFMWILIFVDSV